MSSGSKKSAPKPTPIAAPPTITRTEYNSPAGDRFVSRNEKGTEYFESFLHPTTQGTVNTAREGLGSLAREIHQPDARRVEDIRRRAQDFYDLQAGGINETFDDVLSRTKSGLSQRFGGSLNATFGSDLLSRVERDRARMLSDAHKEAALLGEDLYRQDENSRAQRFALFQNYLTDLNNQAMGYAGQGSTILQNERGRATDLAILRAQQLDRYNAMNAQMEAERRATRSGLLMDLASAGGMFLGSAIPVPGAGAFVSAAARAGTGLLTQ